MDTILFTPRLKLTLLTRAEKGSPEFDWLHRLYSNEKTTWWSIFGRSKSIEDTEKAISTGFLPTGEGENKAWKIVYAVHRVLESAEPEEQEWKPVEFIGLVNLKSLNAGNLLLPEDLTLPASAASTTLTVEIAYMFLPNAWGKGYATESVNAVFDACKRAKVFWMPFERVYVRAIVNEGNPASQKVMNKTGMKRRGIFPWTCKPGQPLFLAGEWRETDNLVIYGMHLLE